MAAGMSEDFLLTAYATLSIRVVSGLVISVWPVCIPLRTTHFASMDRMNTTPRTESCEAQPEGLDAGFAIALAAKEAAEHGDLPDHLAEVGRGTGRLFLCQEIRALPFLLAEQLASGPVRMTPSESHEVCQAPRDHHINGQGQLDLVDMPQLQGFYPTAILEDMEKYFDIPSRMPL